MPEVSAPVIEAREFLRAHLSGSIGFDGDFVPLKIVVAPDGALIAPVMVAMLRSFDITLFLPDEGEDSMQLQVTIEEIFDKGETAALCDRWRIYHGEPEDVRWARFMIDAAKFDGRMYDGLVLMEPNRLADIEAGICKRVNAEMRDALRNACKFIAKVDIEDPRLVGIDPFGFDVRGRFDIIRLEAIPLIADESDAITAIAELAQITANKVDPAN